jgi:type I restriction enzyme S subunit
MHHFQKLLVENIALWSAADSVKTSKRGRASADSAHLYGVAKLRAVILGLAVSGRLVSGTRVEEASKLLTQIQDKKLELVSAGLVKKSKPLKPISSDEIPFDIPKHWVWVRLGEITNFGATEKRGSIGEDVWVLDLEDIEKDTSKLLHRWRYSERQSLSDKNAFKSGDVLYGKLRPYLNKVLVADEDGVCTTEILPIRCYGPYIAEYFKYALKSPYFLKYADSISYGMKMPRLGTEGGRAALFPLPPLAEQAEIGEKINELMLLCDELEGGSLLLIETHKNLVKSFLKDLLNSDGAKKFDEGWERISNEFEILFTTEESIGELKLAIMRLAIMGKLVPQIGDEDSANLLMESIRNVVSHLVAEKLMRKGKDHAVVSIEEWTHPPPEGWQWVRLGQIGDWGAGATPLRGVASYYGGNIPWFKSGELSGDFIDQSEETITELALEKCSLRLNRPGDVLLAMYGATIGKASILKVSATTNQAICACTPYPGVSSEFLLLWLKAMRTDFIDQGVGGAQPNISREKIIATPIALPPQAEQLRIVERVGQLMSICNDLQSCLRQSRELQIKIANALVEQALA